MKNIYVISGVTGMTGSELSRQYVSQGHYVIGFDNFFASSILNLVLPTPVGPTIQIIINHLLRISFNSSIELIFSL